MISLTRRENFEVPFRAVLDQKNFLLAGKARANILTRSVLMFRSAVRWSKLPLVGQLR